MVRVTILGGGFAGLWAMRRLGRRRDVHVTLIDQRPTSDFRPLLPDILGRQIPAAALQADLAQLCRRCGATFVQGCAQAVEPDCAVVELPARRVKGDYLILAAGSAARPPRGGTFHTLDGVADTLALRAAVDAEPARPVVIVGGGYTGIETASHLRRRARLAGVDRRVVLVELADRILPMMQECFSRYVAEQLARLGVEVHTATSADPLSEQRAELSDGTAIAGPIVVFSAGMRPAPVLDPLAGPDAPGGRLAVDDSLRVAGRCFAAGDVVGPIAGRQPLRMGVQFSISQGHHAAGNILRDIAGAEPTPFRAVDLGYVVPLANFRGCGKVLGLSMRGMPPVGLHYAMGIFRSIGLSNRWQVARAVGASFFRRRLGGVDDG